MIRQALFAFTALALTGCATNETVVRDCCYQGSTSGARVAEVPVTLEDGRVVPLSAALPGFQPMTVAVGGPRYPVREVDLRNVVQRDLHQLFSGYDANRDRFLEQPELTVLYIREAARGMGVPVAHVGGTEPIGALDTAAADISGLVQYVRANRSRMTPMAQRVFAEMELQRTWNEYDNSRGPDQKLLIP